MTEWSSRLFFYVTAQKSETVHTKSQSEPGSLCFGQEQMSSVSSDWFGKASVWTSILGLWSQNGLSRLNAAFSGLTCSFSLVCVFCAAAAAALLPVQARWLPLARDSPFALLTRWGVRLTSFCELDTEMPLSVVEPYCPGGSDGKISQRAYGHITTEHYNQWLNSS